MDVNFTNPLAVSLSQSVILVIAAAIIAACVPGGFGIYRDYNKERTLEKQKRLQAYVQLVGIKSLLLHSYIMYYNAQMVAIMESNAR